MSQNLNPSTSSHINYGATSSRVINVPEVNFSLTEFMQLSSNIGENVRAVNSSCMQLEKSLKSNKPINYALQQNQDKIHNIHVKTKEHIDSASRDLQRLNSIVIRGDKQQRLQLDKLQKDFGNVVEKYSTLQRQLAASMKQAIMTQAQMQDQDQEQVVDQENLIQIQRQEQMNLQFENTLLLDREMQIRRIETDVLDINSMMSKIAECVHAQAESVDRIEDRIEYAATEVGLGTRELEKAAAYRRSYRRKVFIILAIAVIVGLIVTGVIVGKFH